MMEKQQRIGFCPHCCNRAPQVLVYVQQYEAVGWMTDADEVKVEIPYDATYFVVRCETCKEILLYHADNEDAFASSELIWPNISLDKAVPQDISRIYDEAIKIKYVAPNAFSVQIRRALEALCKDRGTKDRPLNEQLKELADKGEIPKTLSEASDIIRLIGNVGAHANNVDVHPLQVLAIDGFFKAIVEYVYVSPARIREFKETMNRYGKTSDT
jgi:Domain of unknown function (DUF4145)